ncbi:MAG: serine/threonine-protein kinase, partial [Pirellulaceae bacterium]
MAAVDSEKFIEFVERSKLVPEPQLRTAVADLRAAHGGQLPSDSKDIEQFFIDRDLLTSWHCEKLANGKYKGFHLSKYRLLSLLGTGGMSSVYLAQHLVMNRKVAIKVLPRRRVNDTSYLARFQLEAQAVAHLDHPNIVRAFDIDNEDDTHYIVMEYVPGQDFQALVRQSGATSFAAAADYIAQAADGLQHAHDKGVIHRDIKPANLLLDDRGIVKILDMGLAQFKQEENSSLTIAHEENVLGTADYLAPEQAVNSHKVDHRVDLYSLGCSLYYLIAGHPPFNEGSLAQRIAKHQSVMPPPLTEVRADCPQSLSDLCQKMIAKQPEERFQSAAEVAHTLREWLATHGKPISMIETSGHSAKRTFVSSAEVAGPQGREFGGGEGGSSDIGEEDDLLPLDLRKDSPSSSSFDPAYSEDSLPDDTVNQKTTDTNPRRAPKSNPAITHEGSAAQKGLDSPKPATPKPGSRKGSTAGQPSASRSATSSRKKVEGQSSPGSSPSRVKDSPSRPSAKSSAGNLSDKPSSLSGAQAKSGKQSAAPPAREGGVGSSKKSGGSGKQPTTPRPEIKLPPIGPSSGSNLYSQAKDPLASDLPPIDSSKTTLLSSEVIRQRALEQAQGKKGKTDFNKLVPLIVWC